MRILLLMSILAFSTSNAQTTDTITKAKAWTNTFMVTNPPLYQYATNGHVLSIGFINHYSAGVATQLEVVRMDLTSATATYKMITGALSSSSALWRYAFDSLGNVYLGLNSNNRKIFKFKFSDSIYYENLGNGFQDGSSLAYSLSLGLDGHMYFGGSSGDPYVSEYDPVNLTMKQYPSADSANDYVLYPMGDTDYIYAMCGQRKTRLWAIKKSDSTRILLFNSTESIFNTTVNSDGNCYVQVAGQWYKLKHGTATAVASRAGTSIQPNYFNNFFVAPYVISYFNTALSSYQYSSSTGLNNSINIVSSNVQNNIRLVFYDMFDSSNFYFVGDYYGVWYRNSYLNDTAYPLGIIGFNVYSSLQWDDTTFYFGGYPSGILFRWNKNNQWTTQTFDTSTQRIITGAGETDNPKLITYFRTQTQAGFHHLLKMVRLNDWIVGGGNVIRQVESNTASIGAYNTVTGLSTGYDYNKVDRLVFGDIAIWHDKAIFSTSTNGGHAKLYIYYPDTNLMTDSIDLGYDDYGRIYVVGEKLIGVSNSKVYKIDLITKLLIKDYDLVSTFSMQLSDGRIGITTAAALPGDFWDFVNLANTNYTQTNNRWLYTIQGGLIIKRIKNLQHSGIDINEAGGQIDFNKNFLMTP